MSFNGSGVFSLQPGNPVITGTVISSAWANNTLSDIATNGLTLCLTKDGQQTPTANIPMGGFQITGVGNATTRDDAPNAGQIQDGGLTWLTAVSGTDTITAAASAPSGMTAYVAGQSFRFIAANTNTTGIPTLNINGIGAKNITRLGAQGIVPGDIQSGAVITAIYDGTQFQIIGNIGSSGVIGYARNLSSILVNQGPTIPLTADEIVLENALGGVPYKFKNVSLNCNISAGGLNGWDSGTAPANGFGAVYWMYNPTTGVLGTLGTNATAVKATEVYSAGNAPPGFTVSGLAGIYPLGTVNFTFAPFLQVDRKVDFLIVTILSGSSFIGVASPRTSTAIPLNARFVSGVNNMGCTATSSMQQNLGGSSAAGLGLQANIQTVQAGTSIGIPFRVSIGTPQTIYQTTSNATGTPSFSIAVNSYEF